MKTAVETVRDWEPCFADPRRGVAFFDGISIEADSITDPRRNRVLPVLEEEQVFVCRQMSDALEPGSLVLDVGTGSGVYAIWAAKHGCRVVAVDMSERAIQVARENVKNNTQSHDISLSEVEDSLSPEGLDQIESGEVCLSETTFDENFASDFVGTFDLVILSPPYNPTPEDIYPARHASAGINGQKSFDAQVELAPEVLKEGGRCIGNQMSPSKPLHNGQTASPEGKHSIYAIRKIKNAFEKDRNCTVRYTPMLGHSGATIGVERFLENVYESFTNSFPEKYSIPLDSEGVEDYIDKALEDAENKAGCDNPQYVLIYYEVEGSTEESAIYSFDTRHEVPDANWQDRIQLHRDIIEHTSDPGVIPSHSLFMQHGPVSDFPLTSNNGEKKRSEWEKSPLQIADRWISRRDLVNDESSLFDIMFADAAPVYREAMTPLRLREECKAWTQNIETFTKRLLIEWQLNTQALQKNSVGPLLHPRFVRSKSPHKWSSIQCTTLTSNNKKFSFSERDKYKTLLENIREMVTNSRSREHANDFDSIRFFDNGFSQSELGDLRIPDTSRDNSKYVSAVENRLENVGLNEESSNLGLNALKTDLEACHRVMHEQIHDRFEELLDQNLKWSTLIGIPLSLAYAGEDADSNIEKVPTMYRGGAWVFASGWSREWTLEHEKTLFDFSRLLWLTYNGKFNVDAIKRSIETAKYQAATVSGHEAGPQMTLADTALPKKEETMTDRAYKLIRGSLRYARLFLNETAGNVPDNWLPWTESNGQGQYLDEWIKRSLNTGWEIAVAREARGIEFEDIDKNEDIWNRLIDFDIENNTSIHIDLEDSRFRPIKEISEEKAGGYNITPWNVLRWFLAASSNAYKWCRPDINRQNEADHLSTMDVLEEWSGNIDSLCQVRVSIEQGGRMLRTIPSDGGLATPDQRNSQKHPGERAGGVRAHGEVNMKSPRPRYDYPASLDVESESSRQNTVLLSVSNGCIEPVPENYREKSRKMKEGGTLDALESVARNMGCNFYARPLKGEELRERLDEEEYGFIVTIELPSYIFTK